jgi:glycosyltransferase involved in cell wall biosynthesis
MSQMKEITIIGNFGFGKNCLNGQTVKTRIVTDEILKWFDRGQVAMSDTNSTVFFLLRSPIVLFNAMANSKRILIMPGSRGLLVLPILLAIYNILFNRKLYYVVIGGWLPNFVIKHRFISSILKKYNAIYVETERLKKMLCRKGFKNIYVMPNAKPLDLAEESELIVNNHETPRRFCLFSRIIPEKGIADAVDAIKLCNEKHGEVVACLDIYGQIEDKRWFESLMSDVPNYIKYKGVVDYSESVKTIKSYYALIFPTYYAGECFPGTLIDAMASGVPVIASDWHDNEAIVEDGKTGLIFSTRNVEQLSECILKLIYDPELNRKMRIESLKKAKLFLPQNAFGILKTELTKK